jgi:hypothetical protein
MTRSLQGASNNFFSDSGNYATNFARKICRLLLVSSFSTKNALPARSCPTANILHHLTDVQIFAGGEAESSKTHRGIAANSFPPAMIHPDTIGLTGSRAPQLSGRSGRWTRRDCTSYTGMVARGQSHGFCNTRTGRLGLFIRRTLRNNRALRQWIKYSNLECNKWSTTTVGLKTNPYPRRSAFVLIVLPPGPSGVRDPALTSRTVFASR